MKGGAGRLANAVDRPGASAVGEADVLGRMPITRSVHPNASGACSLDPAVENRYHGVPLGNRQGAARAEVTLDVDQQQGVTLGEVGHASTPGPNRISHAYAADAAD